MGDSKRRKDFEDFITNRIIEEGFVRCKKCKGTGYQPIRDDEGYLMMYENKVLLTPCIKCDGSGQINWIRELFQ